MSLENVLAAIQSQVASLADAIMAGENPPDLGLRRSARLPILAALHSLLSGPVVLITDRTDRALTLVDELSLWIPHSHRFLFPEPTPLFYENASWGITTRRDRLSVISTLAPYHLPGIPKPDIHPVIIVPIRAAMTRTLPRGEFLKVTRTLRPGNQTRLDELLRSWVSIGYVPSNIVVEPGQFARRGGILDIWPPAENQPVRIEFFGNEVETLRTFEPSTQRTVQSIDRIQITPAREYIVTLENLQELKRFLPDYSESENSLSEFFIPILHQNPSGLLEYLPRQATVFLDDISILQDTANEIEEQAVGLRKEFIEDSTLPEGFPTPYLTWADIEDTLDGLRHINLAGEVDSSELDGKPPEYREIHWGSMFTAGPRFAGRLKPMTDYIHTAIHQDEDVVIVSRQAARLTELWAEQEHTIGQYSNKPVFLEGSLTEGWIFQPNEKSEIHLLTDGEIFGWRRPEPRQRPRPVAESPEASYADLKAGDYVVHIDHGIGQLTDLVRRTVDSIEREYLCVEYAEGDQLFVPVYQADRLTRFVGPDNKLPTLTRLGGIEWRATKGRVKEAVVEVAQDLLELYAKRQVVQGFPFNPDTPWQKELEASFPYVETEDQLRVLVEVKKDMESIRPMDRLICGDVGYGKTEVALRAAFKAVMDGKQVAMLVPTTVLAQQHYNTFRERLSAYPVVVEMLSRFRTPQQQQEILDQLLKGQLDIIIGTHRLLQKDIQFKDLGLLIIDEEQRFGVTHKETLRKMRTEVDVITLTATPIPRTLYMALTGIRDISTINTPPHERLPIVTHVGPYSTKLIRQAILRELERGGQVFFVHNRVQTIGAMRLHLEKLVPEARIAVAHGQLPEQDLSKRMEEFTAGEVDILLTTSIIESGLDIPNANTLIVDRADTFGLAQLYQLRGRVGRGAQRAYAYFFRHNKKPPTLEGRERLETISENTQLGAGFSIAMRDLEIRGMGDILGTRQHGYVASVGFHLYTRLLADAVRHIRIQHRLTEEQVKLPDLPEPEIRMPVSIDLPLQIGIPTDYVSDQDTRLRLYRRIADTPTVEQVNALEAEFNDRFGPPPMALLNLLYQLRIKLLAEKAGLTSISTENGQIVLRYPSIAEGTPPRSFPFLGNDVRPGKNNLWLLMTDRENWQQRLLDLLENLIVPVK